MAGLEQLLQTTIFEPHDGYTSAPAEGMPGYLWVFNGTPGSTPIGYLEPAGDGTYRAHYGAHSSQRLGRVRTVEGGVRLVAINHQAHSIVHACRTWGRLDAMHDEAEGLGRRPS